MALNWQDNAFTPGASTKRTTSETLTISSTGTTAKTECSVDIKASYAVIDGPSMDNSGDEIRVNWLPQGSEAVVNSSYGATDDTGTWGVTISLSDWPLSDGDEVQLEVNTSQGSDKDFTFELRG